MSYKMACVKLLAPQEGTNRCPCSSSPLQIHFCAVHSLFSFLQLSPLAFGLICSVICPFFFFFGFFFCSLFMLHFDYCPSLAIATFSFFIYSKKTLLL